MPGSIVFAGIAPHPPLLIPEVGGARIEQVADSQRALGQFARRLLDSNPDTVVVISPHSPLDPRLFTTRSTEQLAEQRPQRLEQLRQPCDDDRVETRRLMRLAQRLTHTWPTFGNDTPRPHQQFLRPFRQIIESVNQTLKAQLDLERHGGRTRPGVCARILQRLLALTAAIWHNETSNHPGPARSLLAYDH